MATLKLNQLSMKVLAVLFIFFWMLSCQDNASNSEKEERPNVIILLADDMGYGDIGSYGGQASTPNLDAFAADGLRFTQFYAAASNCSPSRAGLMTGINPAKLGIYNYRPPGHPLHLRGEAVTMAEAFKASGYQTAHIGKWHLGCLPQDSTLGHPQPDEQGFDYSLGTENNANPSHLNPVNFVRNGQALEKQEGYACQLLADETMHWLEKEHQEGSPFFLYLAFHEPHAVVASPPELVEKYASFPEKDAKYLANIEHLDMAVGRVINALKEKGLYENAIILFTSDNGSYRLASNGGLKAVKSYVYEGGIRVPGILRWPGITEGKRTLEEPLGFVDVFPTLAEGLNLNELESAARWDGTSFFPLLKGEPFSREKPLYWFFYRTSPELAVRLGDYVVLGSAADTVPMTHRFSRPDMDYIRSMQFNSYEVYDLEKDSSQAQDLFVGHKEANRFGLEADRQLREIQTEGYFWKELPLIEAKKRLKKDWVKY